VPVIISFMETVLIVCANSCASTKEVNNEIYIECIFQLYSISFETFRFIAFLDILKNFFLDPKEGSLKLQVTMMLNICFQAYSQTDLCFYIAEIVQNKTGTNNNRSLPRVFFSAALGAVQIIIPSGVSCVQDLVGDSKELEKVTRLYYAFVWSTTFRIPTIFSMYVLVNKMYGIKSSSSYEYLVSRWGNVILIYMTQEVLAEILCRIVDFLLSKYWIDYYGRFSYPKIMLKQYQKHGWFVCALHFTCVELQ